MSFQREQFPTGTGVPDAQHAVAAVVRHHSSAVRGESCAAPSTGCLQVGKLRACFCVPHLDPCVRETVRQW